MGSKNSNRLSTLALVAVAPLVMATCQPTDDTENPYSKLCAGYDPATGKGGPDFGVQAAGRKLNAIMAASVSLVKAANEIQNDALTACRMMAGELGIPAAELEPTADMAMLPGAPVQAACKKVKAKLDEIIATLKPEVKIRVVATPAVCTVNAEFHHNCVQMCEMKTITETELHCKPGKISGTCSATCMGSCTGTCSLGCKGECSAKCTGKCSGRISGKCTGSCTGTCTGMCNGTCMGTCTAMGPDGKCAGMCDGTCMGECSADCQGSCSGMVDGQCEGTCEGGCSATCRGECMGGCTGTCTGGCSVMYQKPYCEEVEVMREVTECETSCETRARAEAMCTEPSLTVTVESNLAEEKMKAAKLIAALRVGMPKLLKVIKRGGGTVKASAEAYASALNGLPTAIVQAGLQGAGCVGAAAQASAQAVGQINASVSVSVEVNASATARVGG